MAGWEPDNLHDQVCPVWGLCYTDPAQHLIAAGWDLVDLDRDLSDLDRDIDNLDRDIDDLDRDLSDIS